MSSWWRVLPLDPSARPDHPGGALYCPRALQRGGRHDVPESFGVIYASADPVSAIAEQLARFRGSGPIGDALLHRAGRRLVLAELRLGDAPLIDLDAPAVLGQHDLRPSQVATRQRAVTQEIAARLFWTEPNAAGIRWWSMLESSWINLTLFAERASRLLELGALEPLVPEHSAVAEAAGRLGLV